jgi:hypothetical protein
MLVSSDIGVPRTMNAAAGRNRIPRTLHGQLGASMTNALVYNPPMQASAQGSALPCAKSLYR